MGKGIGISRPEVYRINAKVCQGASQGSSAWPDVKNSGKDSASKTEQREMRPIAVVCGARFLTYARSMSLRKNSSDWAIVP